MTFGSLFAGIGGLDLGLERAGMECRWQVEIDPFCRKVLEKHWPKVPKYGDITKLSGNELELVDLICGGFPCQDLSQAGKRAGIEGSRSGLWFDFARIIGAARPRYVLIENVPGLLVPGAMRRVVGELAGLGYVGLWRSLRASEFGASHLRKRVFIVAYRVQFHGTAIERRTQYKPDNRRGIRTIAETGGEDVAYREFVHSELRGDAGIVGTAPAGEPGETLAHTEQPSDRTEIECQQTSGQDTGRSPSRSGRSGEYLADAGNGQLPQPGRQPERGDGTGSASQVLPDISPGLEKRRCQRSDDAAQCATAERDCGTLAFAPGPADPRWPAILAARPDLAPALESPVRGVAHGLSSDLDGAMRDRTKRLGRLGNAVVPQVAEWIGRQILAMEAK